VALELNKLSGQVSQMGRTLAERERIHEAKIGQARAALIEHGEVTAELREKIAQAHASDQSWRGADPLGNRLDERHTPAAPPCPATLIAADGSQIYPDRHGIATYYLINTGSIVLRQCSGEAPVVGSRPTVYFEDDDLYDSSSGQLRNTDYINRQRDHQEAETLAVLAEAERAALGGDISHLIVTLADGPLLPWTPQRAADEALAAEVSYLTGQLDRLRRARAVPTGYVDRPGSAYVLRTLDLIDLPLEDINRTTVRRSQYRQLTDCLLFMGLAPNERTGLFASTSEINEHYGERGHRIAFFYMNVARRPGMENAAIARVELPEWATQNAELLDQVQHAVYADCALTDFPYVLARAHELAVVALSERASFDSMVEQSMFRCGMHPAISHKARLKRLTRR
jgi:hypothetical protein